MLTHFKNAVHFFADCILLFLTNGLSFRGKIKRKEYFTGIFGIHFFLFLLLPFLIQPTFLFGYGQILAIFLSLLTFTVSCSATCRRVHDAGGKFYLPILPPISYILFCIALFCFSNIITDTCFYVFFGIFFVLFAASMYYVIKPSQTDTKK